MVLLILILMMEVVLAQSDHQVMQLVLRVCQEMRFMSSVSSNPQ